MTSNAYLQDVTCLPFFNNIVKIKLMEAQQHRLKLNTYQSRPGLFSTHLLDEIVAIHEEQSEFIGSVYQQCAVWRAHAPLIKQDEYIKDLEKLTQKLEGTIDHVLFNVKRIQRMENPTRTSEGAKEVHKV